MQFSAQQQKAIDARNRNILVAASAGSGKTTVLTTRILHLINEGVNIDELLIVTFTRQAASEMKERLRKKLMQVVKTKTLDDHPIRNISHFEEQLLRLNQTHIGTIDSFCNNIVKNYYFLLDDVIDKKPRLMSDDYEREQLLVQSIETVRNEWIYQEGTKRERLSLLMHQLGDDLDDVKHLVEKVRSLAHPEAYLEKMLQKVPKTAKTYFESIATLLPDYLAHCHHTLLEAQEILNALNAQSKEKASGVTSTAVNNFKEALSYFYSFTEQLQHFIEEKQDKGSIYREMMTHLSHKKITKRNAPFNSRTKLQDSALKESILSIVDTLLLNDVPPVFKYEYPKEQPDTETLHHLTLEERIQLNAVLAQTLVDFTREVMKEYQTIKAQKQLVDFSDIAFYAYELLQKETVQQYYQEKFKEILIDEYQDVNQLQNEIMEKMSHNNLFMVGDVKQSIYGFRYADPSIFLEKYETYKDEPQEGENQRIILAENYRSRASVLDYVNRIFLRLMDKEVGEMPYDKDELLIPASTLYQTEDPDIEWLIYQNDKEAEADAYQASHLIDVPKKGYLMMMISKIESLVGKTLIYDGEQQRPLKYSDIAILVSSRKDYEALTMLFKQADIPYQLDKETNYFKTTEISQVLAYLSIINNPYQDIPLVTVLRSPFVQLEEQVLANIRLYTPQGNFYDALMQYAQTEQQDANRIQKFLEQLQNFREMSKKVSVAELIWNIYQETHFIDYVRGMINGEQRHYNLQNLYERARQYEQNGYKGLYAFIQYIEYLLKNDKDIEALPKMTEESSESKGAVQVMTIHQSKGLEFPYVFYLANKTLSSSSALITSEQYGFIFNTLKAHHYRFDNPFTPFVKDTDHNHQVSEFYRNIYVALTRAKEGLIIVAKDEKSLFETEHSTPYFNVEQLTIDKKPLDINPHCKKLSSQIRLQLKSEKHWLWMIEHLSPVEKVWGREVFQLTDPKICYHIQHYQEVVEQFESIVAKKQIQDTKTLISATTIDTKALNQYIKRLEQTYTYQAETTLPNYASVTEMKQRYDVDSFEQIIGQDHRQLKIHDDWAQPKFIQEEASATEFGTAVHYIFEQLPLKVPTLEEIEQCIQQAVDTHQLTKESVKGIQPAKIQAFYYTALGQLLIENPNKVYREQVFSMVVPAFQGSEDTMLVHGIIDGYVVLENQVIVYDFKTNRRRYRQRKEQFIHQMKLTYLSQLKVYKEALALTYPDKEIKMCLYLYDMDELVWIEDTDDEQ